MVTAEILVLLALISLNALLAMSELAVVSSRRSRLQNLVKRRHRGARMALRLLENPTAFAIVVPSITYVQLVVGELVPKRIALNDPERVASALAPVMRGIARVAAPAVWVVRSSTEGLLHVFEPSCIRRISRA